MERSTNWLRTDIEYCTNPDDPEDQFYECNPHSLPDANDNVFITADGTYTVALHTSANVYALTLGGNSGTQTLFFDGDTLRLDGSDFINAHSVSTLIGHLGSTGPAGDMTVDGAIDWRSGQLALQGAIIITTNGSLTLTNDGVHDFFTYITIPESSACPTHRPAADGYNASAYFLTKPTGWWISTGDGGRRVWVSLVPTNGFIIMDWCADPAAPER